MQARDMDPKDFHAEASVFSMMIQVRQKSLRGAKVSERDCVLDGMLHGLAAVLNAKRAAEFIKWEQVPMIVAHELRNIWDRNWDRYVIALDKSENEVIKVYHTFVEECANIAFPDDLLEKERERHRKALVLGEEEVTESDIDWLEARLKSANEEADIYVKLLRRINTQKLAKGGVISADSLHLVGEAVSRGSGGLAVPPRAIKDNPQA